MKKRTRFFDIPYLVEVCLYLLKGADNRPQQKYYTYADYYAARHLLEVIVDKSRYIRYQFALSAK